MNVNEMAKNAKTDSSIFSNLSTELKNKALERIIVNLEKRKNEIFIANNNDLLYGKENNLDQPILKRLVFNENKLNDIIDGIKSLILLEDPVGKVTLKTELDDDLVLRRVTCPIGVIGIIFESRPDALVQISTLCLKSGNCVLLKGGKEAQKTNKILYEIILESTNEIGINSGWIHLMESRDDVQALLNMDKYIDLIIPRGSNEFVKYIMENTKIPVLGHADGICHCYVDKDAEIKMSLDVVVDSKTQYVSVCNATETLLVHKDIAEKFLPKIKEEFDKKNVEIKGCINTKKIIDCGEACDDDWKTEYLDYIISIKIVDSIDDAVNHINTYGSGHTDVIITQNNNSANYFMDRVDSGNVFWNCSSRFSDGFRFGFGAEVGVSTTKIHSRGPVGLEGLLIYKYKLCGNGNIVDDYSTKKRNFKHKKIL